MKTLTATFQNGQTVIRKSSKPLEWAIAGFNIKGELVEFAFASDLNKAVNKRDRYLKRWGGHWNAEIVRTKIV